MLILVQVTKRKLLKIKISSIPQFLPIPDLERLKALAGLELLLLRVGQQLRQLLVQRAQRVHLAEAALEVARLEGGARRQGRNTVVRVPLDHHAITLQIASILGGPNMTPKMPLMHTIAGVPPQNFRGHFPRCQVKGRLFSALTTVCQ